MTTKGSDTYWRECAAHTGHGSKGCNKRSGREAGAPNVALSGPYKGKPVCAGCAAHLGIQRAGSAKGDTQAQRAATPAKDQAAQVLAGEHKANYTRGGHVRGGFRVTDDKPILDALVQVGKVKVTKVDPATLRTATTAAEVKAAATTGKVVKAAATKRATGKRAARKRTA